MSGSVAVTSLQLDGFEGMHEAVRGTRYDVVQLGRGKLGGSVRHIGVGEFSLSVGSFDVGLRLERVATDDKLIVGMLLHAADRVSNWSFDLEPADVIVIPPLVEHHSVCRGATAYAAAIPIVRPANAVAMPRRKTMRRTLPRAAPKAMRMPISCVCSDTT